VALALSVVELSAAVPSAPTTVVAVGGDREAVVSFAPPQNSSPDIKNYTLTASPGGRTESGKSSPLTVTKLTNGTAYTFTVTATNADGTSAASNTSAPIVPSADSLVGMNIGISGSVIRINSTVIDSAGNIYLAGSFDGSTLLFNGVTLNILQ